MKSRAQGRKFSFELPATFEASNYSHEQDVAATTARHYQSTIWVKQETVLIMTCRSAIFIIFTTMRGTMMAIEKFHLPVHDDHSRKH
jgi:hypothetical protein